MVLSRPARTHVLPAPQNPDGLTIAPIRRSAESQSATAFMPDNGQVERMNRTIKEATVKRFHYESHEQLRTHLRSEERRVGNECVSKCRSRGSRDHSKKKTRK